MNRPRLLILNLYMIEPANSGAKILIKNRIRELSRSFDITFCCLQESEQDFESARLLEKWASVRLINPKHCRSRSVFRKALELLKNPMPLNFMTGMSEWIDNPDFDEVVATQFDLVEIHSSTFFHRKLLRFSGKKVLAIQNDESEYYQAKARITRKENGALAALPHYCSAALATRQQKNALLLSDGFISVYPFHKREMAGKPFLCSHGGLNLSDFDFSAQNINPPIITFIGAMFVENNIEAVRAFVEQSWPKLKALQPSAELRIVGDHRNRSDVIRLGDVDGVTITGLVDSVEEELKQAWVVIIPIQSGSGIRFKLLEALAAGKAVVSTPKGAEGIAHLENNTHLLVTQLDEFSNKIDWLIRNPFERQVLENAAKRYSEKYLDSKTLHQEIETFYKSLLDRELSKSVTERRASNF